MVHYFLFNIFKCSLDVPFQKSFLQQHDVFSLLTMQGHDDFGKTPGVAHLINFYSEFIFFLDNQRFPREIDRYLMTELQVDNGHSDSDSRCS